MLRISRLLHFNAFDFIKSVPDFRLLCTATCAVEYNDRSYVPRRALMYVPASDLKKIEKIQSMPDADCIVLDAEDGVALSSKEMARENAISFFRQLSNSNAKSNRPVTEFGFRVNSVASGLLEVDLKAIADAGVLPDAFMLPKVDRVSDLQEFSRMFRQLLLSQIEVAHPKRLVIWIESAIALTNVMEILAAAKRLHRHIPLWLDAVVFGSDDFSADIGVIRSPTAVELQFARQSIVVACAAHRLQRIDMNYIDFRDELGLRRQCAEGVTLGFTGKQVIHPAQISVVQEAFMPKPEIVQWARDLVSAYESSSSVKGAIDFKGQMIDAPLVLQARNILTIADRSNR